MNPVPETVILFAQEKIYKVKNTVEADKAILKDKLGEVEKARRNLEFSEKQLRELADFLSEHNSDCNSDWHGEVGLEK